MAHPPHAAPAPAPPAAPVDVTVLMPCLNEADTIEVCIRKALETVEALGIRGEVVVADNGSTDGSPRLADAAGARVVPVEARGYGSALMGGIDAARGRWVIMEDADDSYDFREIGKFVEKLREGWDVVQGCRLPGGGGRVMPGAMPFLHRWWGNPMFTLMARWMFRAPIHDIYCGLRGFRAEWQRGLGQRCTGMEFATEMLIKASLTKARITEVPITLHPDGRQAHAPHLKTFRDGWRTFRFFFVSSPRWLFLVPGLLLIASGAGVGAAAMAGIRIGPAHLDVHTLLLAGTALVIGWQCVLFAVFAKTFGIAEHLLPPDPHFEALFHWATLERGLIAALAGGAAGSVLWLIAAAHWWNSGFGPMDYPHSMRLVIPGSTLLCLSAQTAFGSFFISILGLKRR